jgi:hypothetical protein
VLTIIGLTIGVVGAVVLAWGPVTGGSGLIGTYGGVEVSAERRARDLVSLFVGVFGLVLGFVMQALPLLGVSESDDVSCARRAGVTLVLASLVAWLAVRTAVPLVATRIRIKARDD